LGPKLIFGETLDLSQILFSPTIHSKILRCYFLVGGVNKWMSIGIGIIKKVAQRKYGEA